MEKNKLNKTEKALVLTSRAVGIISIFFIVVIGIFIAVLFNQDKGANEEQITSPKPLPNPDQVNTEAVSQAETNKYWSAPGENSIPSGEDGELVRYGKELIAHTSTYLGPKGKVANISNGMNCQNCHLDAGTKTFGNNYSAVYSTYPKFRARSGTEESIEKRINDCFERSLNGKPLQTTSKEMKAMVAYMTWLGTGVEKGERPEGVGLQKLAFMDRPADPELGSAIYEKKCLTCHGKNGEGLLNADQTEYTYPPLWGKNSYNDGAGLYRLIGFSGYVKNNMPLGATYENPQLSDEEAWDVAAYVNSKPRPHKDQKNDYKDIAKKPIDFPFGPYADKFSEKQHKYGPFKPIAKTGS